MTLLADGSALVVLHSDKVLRKLSPLPKRKPNIRRAGIRCGDVIWNNIPAPGSGSSYSIGVNTSLQVINNNHMHSLICMALPRPLSLSTKMILRTATKNYTSVAYKFSLYAAYIKPVIFYHSSHAASGHPLASNATQPFSPLFSKVDSGRGAGWYMRRCKRERRRILSVALILRDASRYRRAFCRRRDT